jgi:hypothetical protein
MKFVVVLPSVVVALCGLLLPAVSASAQDRIYRCGNEYTNNATEAQARTGCKVVEGGNVTVVDGTSPAPVSIHGSPPSARGQCAWPSAATQQPLRFNTEQRARDADAQAPSWRQELKKAEARHAELLKEYNNGEPEKQDRRRDAQLPEVPGPRGRAQGQHRPQ